MAKDRENLSSSFHGPDPEMFHGCFDRLCDGYLEGWIRHKADLTPVVFDLMINGQIVAEEQAASLSRRDLLDAGLGSVAFCVLLPEAFSGTPLDIELRLSGRDTVLLRSHFGNAAKWNWGCLCSQSFSIQGRIDGVDDGVLSGWLHDPNSSSNVEFSVWIEGEQLPLNYAANLRRQDLVDFGIGDRAFQVLIPSRYSGRPFSVEIRRVDDRQLLLKQSFEDTACWHADVIVVHNSDYVGGIDSIIDGWLDGWVSARSGVDGPRFDIYINGELIHSAILAELPRIDLAHLPSMNVGFRFPLPRQFVGHRITVNLRLAHTKIDLLSREFGHAYDIAPPRYKVRIESADACSMRGWIIDSFNPDKSVSVQLEADGIVVGSTTNCISRPDLTKHGLSPAGIGGFEFLFDEQVFTEGQVELLLHLPDGSTTDRLSVEASPKTLPYWSNPNVNSGNLSVVVPIYNAADDFRVCAERLIAFTPLDTEIIFVDDASTDPLISEILDAFSRYSNIRTIKNSTNLGFTRSVNIGIAEAGRKDVVLLNSDARVTPRWIEGLLRAASSDNRICTVTPLSDRAGAFSAPHSGNHNPLPHGVNEIEFSTAFRRLARGLYPNVPTGNGFCMYVRRSALDEVGNFDASAFPRGYGEENDFCMRAERKGWRHVIDDRTYVFHERSKSFGAEKAALLESGALMVESRYPEYRLRTRSFSKDKSISTARLTATSAQMKLQGPVRVLPRALFVISTTTGGTPQTNRDLMTGLDTSYECWILHCDGRILSLSRRRSGAEELIRQHKLRDPLDPITFRSFDYNNIISSWLSFYEFDVVHVRHLAWHSVDLPRLSRDAGSAVIFSFHDYHAICPTIKLLDENANYCGGLCTSTPGDCVAELWKADSLPALKNKWVHRWRELYNEALSYCDAFITTSDSARTLIERNLHVDTERLFVIPHGRDFDTLSRTVTFRAPGQKLKILVPGNIDEPKGAEVIRRILELDDSAHSALEFHVMGKFSSPFTHDRLQLHGAYSRSDFINKAREIDAHVGAILSIWDETWCHTLTELWSCGLPVVALDYPTVATRIRESGAGWVFAKDDLTNLYNGLVELGNRPEDLMVKIKMVQNWQQTVGRGSTNRLMASRYENVYRIAANKRDERALRRSEVVQTAMIVAVVCPAESNLDRANASTHIRVWERTINNRKRSIQYCRMSPDQFVAAVASGYVRHALLQRNVLQDWHWQEICERVKDGSLKIVIDLDDDLFSVPVEYDIGMRYHKGMHLLAEVLSEATAVIVSTEALRKKIQSLNGRTFLVSNALSRRIWKGDITPRIPDGWRRGLYVGTKSHVGDFELILPSLNQAAALRPDLRIRVIGVLDANTLDLPWLEVVHVPGICRNYPEFVRWLKLQTASCDFGLAPLDVTDFSSSKSPLKLLEYAALGLPTIASRGTVYDNMCEESPKSIKADNNLESWRDSVLAMCEQPVTEHLQWSARLRDWVFRQHSFDIDYGYDQLLMSAFATPEK